MTRTDYRRISEAFLMLSDMFGKMADEAAPLNEQQFISRAAAAKIMGCSRETVRNRIEAGLLTEYTAGLKVDEVMAYASGVRPVTPPAQTEYKVQSLRRSHR